MRKERTRIRDQQSNIGMSWQVAEKMLYLRQNILDEYGRTVKCPGRVGVGQHTEDCRTRVEQEMVDKGDAIKLEASGNQEEIAQEPDANLQKRRIGDQISIQAGRRA